MFAEGSSTLFAVGLPSEKHQDKLTAVKKYAELNMSSPCWNCAQESTDSCHWMTWTLRKTLKQDESRANSAAEERSFFL